MIFCCPVCKGALEKREKSLFCPNGHCYDISKYGYVNLLMSNQSSAKRHGDDRLMVEARRDFLDAGHYSPIRDALLEMALPCLQNGSRVLDAGCGEGWYTAALYSSAKAGGLDIAVACSDISKDALRYAARRLPGAEHAVSSSAHLPVVDGGCDMLLNLFSPLETAEFRRVLNPGGSLIRAVVLPKHLWSLKAAVYDVPYENGEPETELEGFELSERVDIRTRIKVEGMDVKRLFSMTPYYYKTSAADQAKLDALDRIETELEVCLLRYSISQLETGYCQSLNCDVK
ncbi:MAG: methyltransferase domain-containing protein [Clostridiales bacterium]|nr:methyltransferase domain-containing protein [Clostridiales bacterium]